MAKRNWRKHWHNYIAHWLTTGVAGIMSATSGLEMAGLGLAAYYVSYQLGSYWHKPDTLKLDLFDGFVGFGVGVGVAAIMKLV